MKKLILIYLVVLSCFGYAQNKSIQLERNGSGQAIIFLPGFTCPGDVWDETIAELGNKFEYIKVTYPGFGGVDPISIPWYGSIKSELKAFIVENDLSDIIIIGHSMGGMLAMDIAADLQEKVSKMVLVDALPCIRQVMMPDVSEEYITFDNPYNNSMMAMADSTFEKNARLMANGMTNDESRIDLLTKWIVESDRETYVYGYTELLKLDLRNKIGNVSAKTLVISADFIGEDLVLKSLDSQYEKLKNKEIKIAKNSKHFIMFDQPEWFVNELNDFLN